MMNKLTPNKYDAGDMGDAHNLAKEDLSWMITALQHVAKEIKSLAESIQVNDVTGVNVDNLLNHLSMYEYVAQVRQESHSMLAEKFYSEWEVDKASLNIQSAAQDIRVH